MPNPFDLRGPEFLVFYSVLGVLVTLMIVWLRRRSEPRVETTVPLTDYLKIAYLRGGAAEALRVATLALVDRGLVEVVEDDHLKAKPATIPAGLLRTEQRLLESCKDPTRANAIVEDEGLKITVAAECEGQLVRAGLLPDANVKADRQWLLILGLVVLGLVAVVKILVALSRGRTNIAVLIVLVPVFAYVLYRVANPSRTMAGEAMLADLRRLFAALKDRTTPAGPPTGTNELALLAAVFGIGALPAGHGYVTEALFRKKQREASSSSCGSASCGSGSSCGSSCGGGCGGGCGGCGG